MIAPTTVASGIRQGESIALVLLAVALCLEVAGTSRMSLNSDGVSSLDLARRMRAGDPAAYWQGYWSPLYPALIALLLALGALHPLLRDAESGVAARPYRWMVASALGWLAVIGVSVIRFESNIRAARRAERLRAPALTTPPGPRIAVVGPVMPPAAAACLTGGTSWLNCSLAPSR